MPGPGSRRPAPSCSQLRVAALAAVAALSACTAGSGEGLSVSGRPLEEGGGIPLAATLESIQANVFDASCVVCHSGANAPLALRLDNGNSYASLVGVRSRQNGSQFRVEPGDPDASYLVRKLEGTANEGGRMPLEGAPIPQSTIDFIRQWILDGAPADAGPPPGQPPRVVSLAPAPGTVEADLPAEVTAAFDSDMDASTINAMTFLLERSGGDGQFGNGNDVPVSASSVALSAVNPRLAVMDLAGVAAVPDFYRVTLKSDGVDRILGIDALALDGEFGGVFPSGDGSEGGDFLATFEIVGLQPTLASIQSNVFTPSCAVAGCHTGPSGPGLPAGLDLSSAASSAASLIGVASVQVPAIPRVAPNNSGGSYLVQKLEGTAAVGQRMPRGGAALDPASIAVIRQWIDTGAQP